MESKTLKILAIDDIQDNLITLKALINESIGNAKVYTALSGKIGLEIAASENPDVILLDILMPEMDGYEVCKILKADTLLKEIPVVFITALKGDKATRIKALEVGADAFLTKPIDESELFAQIKAMVKIKEANYEKLNKEKILLDLVAEKTKSLEESNQKALHLLDELIKESAVRRISEQAVIESEIKYSKAFQTSPYCITITSLNDGTFVDVNESFCETTGFTKEEVIGKKVGEINVWFNLEDRKYVINSLLKNEKIEQQLAYFRKKNGEKIIAIYSAQVIHINGASHILASINDITKQKLAELNLLKLNRIQSLNSQINDLIIRIHNKMQLFEEVCEIATTYGNFRMSWISQIDEQSKVITPLVWHGHEDGYLKEIQKISIENNLYGIGPTGIAFREGKVSVCNNIATDPKMEPWRKEALKRGYLSSIALPIKVRKKVIGTFNLYSGEVDFFAQNEEVELLENITSNISFSLEKILDEEDKIEAEQKVREKDIEFRKLSANVSDLIFQFTRRPDGSYFVPIASEGIINIFGCKPEDVANDFTAIANVIHPEDAERVFNDIEYSAAHLTNFTCEFRVLIPGKPVQWIYSKSTPEKLADGSVTWYGFNSDITERKQAEIVIKENEERHKAITLTANDGIVSSNNKGIITGWNRAAEKIFGYTDDEIIGKPLTEIIPPHFKEFHEKGIERFDKKGEKNVIGKTLELQGLHKNGTIFPLELSLAEWETSKGKFITGFIKDITERKRAELELEKSISTIRKLSVAIEQSPVTTVITDLDGGIVFTNPKFTEATGYSPEEALGKNPRLLNSGYTTKDEYKKLWETILSGNSWHGVFQNKKKNGELFWEKTVISPVKNELGEIINFLALKEDITDQKKTDEAFQKNLRELEDYKFALDETAIVSITDKDGIITYANKNFSNISKYSNDELVGQNHRIVNSGYHDKEYFKNMWSTITNGKVWVGELRNKAKDGRVYWVYGTIIPFLDKKNIPTQYLAIRFDITERKTAEEGVLLSNERYNLVAKATNDSIWDLNILTNEIIRSGGGFEALFGYKINQDNEEYLHYKNLIHPDDLERVIASKIEIFDNPNEFNWEQDYRFLKANGEYAFVHDKGYIIRDEKGKAIRMIGATQDITEREQHIKSIEDQNTKLREIAWKQSHIVRAPVARIMGLINLLKYEEQVGEETVQLLKYIEMSAHELDAVIKSIVTSTSNDKG